MAAVNLKLHPPIQYDWIWLILGLVLLATLIGWLSWVLWSTRKKLVQSIDTLDILPAGIDFDRIKAKYIKLIDERYALYQKGKIDDRQFQQDVSRLVRNFIYEVRHFPAPRLTLTDLMMAAYPLLTKLIAKLYPGEFDMANHWSAEGAAEEAKGYIRQWSS